MFCLIVCFVFPFILLSLNKFINTWERCVSRWHWGILVGESCHCVLRGREMHCQRIIPEPLPHYIVVCVCGIYLSPNSLPTMKWRAWSQKECEWKSLLNKLLKSCESTSTSDYSLYFKGNVRITSQPLSGYCVGPSSFPNPVWILCDAAASSQRPVNYL